ncbi:MAG: FAD-dependent oxidoreductase [Clostridia bacterium]|nr:FAD-dependent oxidoreductase [Clostridia bacterium]
MELTRKIENRYQFDVIVVGGGIGGVAAAVAASRGGAKTLLIEKSINLGGLATSGLISWYEPLCDGQGQQMIEGLSEELIRLSTRIGFDNLPAKWGGKSKNPPRNERFSTYYSPTVFSVQLDSFVMENGVALRLDSLVTGPVMEDGVCRGIMVESVGGCELFEADMFIDATGDATLMHRAGVPTEVGKNYFTYIAHGFNAEGLQDYIENGNLCTFRKWYNVGSTLVGVGHPEGMERLTGLTADDVTKFVTLGKEKLLQRISGWEKDTYEIMTLPSMPQYRTVRRILGNCDFCGIDGQTFEDSIGNCGDFRKKNIGRHYQIPFGSLWNRAFPNLLACGRIISAPEGDGWEASRVIPVCALTGEAAGKAAALCVREKKLLTRIDGVDLQKIKIN